MRNEEQDLKPRRNLDGREVSSSVVIRGLDATTFAQMEDFVKDLETRSLDRLMRDLPQLAALAATKFALVSYVISGKYRNAASPEKETARQTLGASIASQSDAHVRGRLQRIFDRLK